jgi:two-component system cell cycle sensor histidine kinase/response regulator CckA
VREAYFTDLASHLRQVVWLREPNRLLFLSANYAQVWGQPATAMEADPWAFLERVHAEDRARVEAAYRRQLAEPESKLDIEYRLDLGDGAHRWIGAQSFSVRGGEDGTPRWLGIAEDITDRHLLEDQLRQAQKMESIGQLAGGVAHDFNNLLTVIAAHAELVEARVSEDSDVRDSVRLMREAVGQASGVTRSLLTFSRKVRAERKPINLAEAIQGAARMLERTLPAEIELILDLDPKPEPRVCADATQLQQVVLNLAVNARDAMPEGGKLYITLTAPEPMPGLRLRDGTPAPQGARLVVSDTGVGMDASVMEHVFEPFFTTKPRERGTGLGLAVVHGIVEEHQGRISIESAVNVGSSFLVELPCLEWEEEDVAQKPHTQVPVGRGELILLAEDFRQVREIVAAALTGLGYRVLQAGSGGQCLELAEAEAEIALFILDVNMPHCSGLDCLKRIRERSADVPVIIITGSVEVEVSRDRDAHTVLLPKPFQIPHLGRLVHELLTQKIAL